MQTRGLHLPAGSVALYCSWHTSSDVPLTCLVFL
jgi:hypothetical protein